MDKKFGIGFYGGKYLPPHLGHGYCICTMSSVCEEGHIILFHGGDQELDCKARGEWGKWADVQSRLDHIKDFIEKYDYDNLYVHSIDVTDCKTPDGKEDWDMETPLVRAILPHIDAVFTGGPTHHDYFTRAYPEAYHYQVDPIRAAYPISSTMIRHDMRGLRHWMI